MAVPKPRGDYRFSYADYLAWPDEERWEIIDGVPYDMSPAPSRRHQEILGRLYRKIANYLDGKKCRPYLSPLDVRLPDRGDMNDIDREDDETTCTVVQPDILVVCNNKKIDDRGCKGAPDICIEILSPATAYKDETEKFLLYQKHGVQEYWIVNPDLETITLYMLHNGEYGNPVIYKKGHILQSSVLEGLQLDVGTVMRDQSESL